MKDTLPIRVRFGVFELNLKAGELCRGEERILLQEQPLQVLLMLVERDGEIATREEIKKQLWPNDTIVEFDHSINAAIRNLRRALGDSATEPKFIETIARRGYRLLVSVEYVGEEDSSGDESYAASPSYESAPSESDFGTIPQARLKAGWLTGKVVSHYRVLDVIGGGGMGVVYRAEDLKLGRAVGLKFLPEDLGDDAKARERFVREAKAVSVLNHPNICSIYEFEEHDGHPFIVMELLQGRNLRDQLAAGRFRLTQPEGLEIAIQIASGLEAAHEKGIVHRDIKPANVFITAKNVAKILDFGVAKVLQLAEYFPVTVSGESATTDDESLPTAPTASVEETALTRTGLKLGTAGYMSPEQIGGKPLDARTDIFSFGLILYEMATGERAFTGESEAILHDAIQHRAPRRVRDLAPEITPSLEEVIGNCLAKEPSDRYRSAAEVRDALAHQRVQLEPWSPSGALSPAKTKKRWPLIAAAAVVLVAALAGGGLYYRSHQAKPLTDKDSIVIADFDNKTGDAMFDDTLKTALTVTLNQSPFLNVLPDNKVNETLKLMTKPAGTKLTPEVARELCQRAGSKAYIAGSIATLGSEYVIGLKAVNCRTDDPLAQEQVTASGKENVLNAVGDVAAKLREPLGESVASIQKFDVPVEQATTPSLEALKAYAAGDEKRTREGDLASIPFYNQAVEIDPNFATAYARLAAIYGNIGERTLSEENAQKAFALRDRTSEHERFYITDKYYSYILGDLPKIIENYELWIQTYPRDDTAHNNLAVTYRAMGDFQKSAEQAREAIRLQPDNWQAYGNLSWDYLQLNQLEEAKAIYKRAVDRKQDSRQLHQGRFMIAYLEGDTAEMDRQVAALSGRTEQIVLIRDEGMFAAQQGRIKEARALFQQAFDMAKNAGLDGVAATAAAERGEMEYWMGDNAAAKSWTSKALALSNNKPLVQAWYPAFAGDTAKGQALVNKEGVEYPKDTLLHAIQIPVVEAAVAIQSGKPQAAIEVLKAAEPYQGGYPRVPFYRGLAYFAMKSHTEAVAEFTTVRRMNAVSPTLQVHAINRLYLARALAMAGDTAGAKREYQDLLAFWKDADPDMPLLLQARAEYAKLQ